MNLNIGSIWKDKYDNLSKVKILKLNEDYYRKVEYEWICCEQDNTKLGKKNYLSEDVFLNIYDSIDIVNDNVEENLNLPFITEEKKMKYKAIKTSSGKIIEIFDDVYTPSERLHHLCTIQNCPYFLGANSHDSFWQKNKTFFQTQFNQNQLNELGVFSSKSFDSILPHLNLEDQDAIKNSWALVSTPFSTYYYHIDCTSPYKNEKTLLYYVNDRWDKNWGGETLFSDETGEPEYAVQYKPGRIVVFDNSIEHKPASISMEADEFRFIFVAQFFSKQPCESSVSHRYN